MSQQITKRKCPWGGKYADHNGYCNPAPGEEHTHCFTYSNYDSDSESKPESKQPESIMKPADVLPTLIAPKSESKSMWRFFK